MIKVKCHTKTLHLNGMALPCRIGRAGFIDGEHGREGDEKTPLGHYHLRFGFYRADRLPSRPPSSLTLHALTENDGWCDEENHAAYNRFVRLPFHGSHEALWRKDGAYDIILVMSHNDSPPQTGHGSAVFIHIAQPDDRQTLGCIALTPDNMVKLLPHLRTGTPIIIEP